MKTRISIEGTSIITDNPFEIIPSIGDIIVLSDEKIETLGIIVPKGEFIFFKVKHRQFIQYQWENNLVITLEKQ